MSVKISEFEITINKRDTIVRYKEGTSIKDLIWYFNYYIEENKRKLKLFEIRKEDEFVIIDKEYEEYEKNNKCEVFYADNDIYVRKRAFRPKRKWNIFNRKSEDK